jgi:DNA repair protein RadC
MKYYSEKYATGKYFVYMNGSETQGPVRIGHIVGANKEYYAEQGPTNLGSFDTKKKAVKAISDEYNKPAPAPVVLFDFNKNVKNPEVVQDKDGLYTINDMGKDDLVALAMSIVEDSMRKDGEVFTDPEATKKYISLRLGETEHEVFTVMFLDNRHRLIASEDMFKGTINGASVHPREVVKAALKYNAAAVIFGHNHPSGIAEPSEADRQLTNKLKAGLGIVDIRVLDHIVVGGTTSVSFAERGWM